MCRDGGKRDRRARLGVGRFRDPYGDDGVPIESDWDDGSRIEDFEDSTRCTRLVDAAPIEITDETVSRFQEIMMVRLSRRGVAQTAIARIFNISQASVSRRLASVPPRVRSYYETLSMG